MATPQKKKPTLEEFLWKQSPQREEYVTQDYTNEVLDDGKVVAKSKTAKAIFDPETKKTKVENAPIGVDADLEEAQAPRQEVKTLKQRILPPEEETAPLADVEPPPYAPKYSSPATEAAPRMEVPQATGPSAWERFLVGATPALVGLLSGNELEGMQISGKTLVDTEADLYKRERDFNTKLAEMKAKRAMGVVGKNERKPNFAREEIYDPKTKKTYIHSIVDGQDAGILGEAAPNRVKESYIKEIMYNPETRQMEVAAINPKTHEVTFYGKANIPSKKAIVDVDFQGEPTKAVADLDEAKITGYLGKAAEKKSPYADLEEGRNKRFQDQKLLDLTKEFAKPTSNFNKMKENLDGIVMAADQLNLGNPRANAGLQNYLARNVYGEKGPLSDSDIARLAGDPSYGAVIERFLSARLQGTLNELDRGDIRQILDLAYKVQKEKMLSEASRFGNAFKTVGYDPTPGIQAYVQGAIRPLPGHRRFGALAPKVPKAGEVKNGYKFKGGDPSKKENWEKQ